MTSTPNTSHNASAPTNGNRMQDSKGWDGKLRVDRRAVVTNAEILSDPEYSDEDAPPVEQIDADEGGLISAFSVLPLTWQGQTCWKTMNLILTYVGEKFCYCID